VPPSWPDTCARIVTTTSKGWKTHGSENKVAGIPSSSGYRQLTGVPPTVTT
jgi:hypothetical protein